ncbi:MAG: hypothetical protein V7K27_25615 [Nostoc sp.]|uniref:hypothetical protein n=1 Tax=Nostoc sp. TaxID=1180 RepID=UPI002FF5D337
MSDVLNGIKKAVFITVGTVSLVIGVVGLILPLVPGIPFLIASVHILYQQLILEGRCVTVARYCE